MAPGKNRIAILASGSGSTAEAVATDLHENPAYFNFEIGLVITNNPDAQVLDRVKHWNKDYGFDVETAVINSRTHPGGKPDRGIAGEASEAMAERIIKGRYDVVACLGYMLIIKGALMDEFGYHEEKHTSPYEARMTNNHPGSLPLSEDTFADGPSALALEAYHRGEVTHSHFSFHVVAPGVDRGPVIVQKPVPIYEDDTPETLFARTQLIEKAATAHAIDKFAIQNHLLGIGKLLF